VATTLRPIGHEERLSLVDHLDELRSRLIVCVVTLAVASGLCYWQNGTVLHILNKPLDAKERSSSNKPSGDPLEEQARFGVAQRRALQSTAALLQSLDARNLSAAQRAAARKAARDTQAAARLVPTNVTPHPITLGVTEPFTQTLTVSFYAGLLLSLPILLYQLYAFIIPAFTPRERRVALPIMALVPLLFLSGVAFGYFVVLQRAISFLQNFNDDNFDILVQASTYYKFCVLFLGAIGLLFQIPVAVLAVTRTGILTPRQLRKGRGYAILVIAIVAAVATPTPDPVTMTLAMGPLIVLYELSILLAAWLDRVRPPAVGDDDLELHGNYPED
jgi:sec-independent protein translocase protein TatC